MTDPTTPSTPGRELRPGQVVLGAVLGLVVCWIWIVVVLVVGLSVAYGSESDAAVVAAVAVAGLPVVVGVVLIARPGTRQAGAGFLMGLAIGLIAGAGVCASLFGLG
ncbi:MAG: hypothetical protein ACXWW7_17385 [Nocardioides sp.]